MSQLDDLKTAQAALQAKADALIAFAVAQQTLNQQLQATIAAGGIDPATAATLQGIVDGMNAETAKIAAVLPAPTPAATTAA